IAPETLRQKDRLSINTLKSGAAAPADGVSCGDTSVIRGETLRPMTEGLHAARMNDLTEARSRFSLSLHRADLPLEPLCSRFSIRRVLRSLIHALPAR